MDIELNSEAALERLRARLEEVSFPSEFSEEGKRRVYLVGGCIRDAFLGRKIADLDFAVDGSGLACAEGFSKWLGATFVPLKSDEGRVVFQKRLIFDFSGLGTTDIQDDLWRRDFTINAMAIKLADIVHGQERVIDPTSGLRDLRSRCIKMTTEKSLTRDPIRILRAVRFASQLGFEIEPETQEALKEHSGLVSRAAAERLSYEFFLVLETEASFKWVTEMRRLGILTALLPELRDMESLRPQIELLDHSISSVEQLEGILSGQSRQFLEELEPWMEQYFAWERRRPLLKLATLLHDIGKPSTFSTKGNGEIHFYGHDTNSRKLLLPILKERLRLSRREVGAVTHLVRHHMRPHLLGREEELSERAMRRFFSDLGEEWVGVLLLAFADALATDNGGVSNLRRLMARLTEFREAEEKKGSIERLITGEDLIEHLGLQPGPIFKKILKKVEEEQLEGKISTKEQALEMAKEVLEEE